MKKKHATRKDRLKKAQATEEDLRHAASKIAQVHLKHAKGELEIVERQIREARMCLGYQDARGHLRYINEFAEGQICELEGQVQQIRAELRFGVTQANSAHITRRLRDNGPAPYRMLSALWQEGDEETIPGDNRVGLPPYYRKIMNYRLDGFLKISSCGGLKEERPMPTSLRLVFQLESEGMDGKTSLRRQRHRAGTDTPNPKEWSEAPDLKGDLEVCWRYQKEGLYVAAKDYFICSVMRMEPEALDEIPRHILPGGGRVFGPIPRRRQKGIVQAMTATCAFVQYDSGPNNAPVRLQI